MQPNIILNTDSYKAAHWRLYPPGTEHVYCYLESRGGRWNETLFFGLQAFLYEYLEHRVTPLEIEMAANLLLAHGEPSNREGWTYIFERHGGRLPVSIRAAPEGAVVPTHNVLMTIENTDPRCYWLPTYLETALLRAVWYPTTVATQSWQCKRIILSWLNKTSDDPEGKIDFKLHDFGSRGVSSEESAAIGGLAHLVNFRGTDTLSALLAGQRWYGETMAGYSIPASEHSTVISWGPTGEADSYRNLLDKFLGAGKTVACVSDSYNLWAAITQLWGGEFRDRILKSGGTLVIRPDSGDPATVVCRALDMMGDIFGYTINTKGFKMLPSCVRLIQGDGVDDQSIGQVLAKMAKIGWAADNVAFGMGGALLQRLDRDTQRFAMKPSHVTVSGQGHCICKSPIDDLSKSSMAGRFKLVKRDGVFATATQESPEEDHLVEVFRDGSVQQDWDLAEIRTRARGAMAKINSD